MTAAALETLRGARFSLPLPLQLTLHVTGAEDRAAAPSTLTLLQVFRILPGKRVVALAEWQGEQVIAKIFFAAGRWQQHLQRELRGITALRDGGIAAADLLNQGSLHDTETRPSAAVLLLEYLQDGVSLGNCWDASSSSMQRQELLRRVISQIAQCHQQGLWQKDIHLDNFMLKAGDIYLLDAADVHATQTAGSLPEQDCLQNLALFLAQFPVSNDEHLGALLAHYHGCRASLCGDSSNPGATGEFRKLVHHWRNRRWMLYRQKLFRETSAHVCRQSWSSFLVFDRQLASTDLERFIADPDGFIEQGRLLKAGNSATVAAVLIDGQEYIVKRYNIKTWLHGTARLLRPSRAWISWRNAHMLQMLGLATARPCLMLENRMGPLRRNAYFLAESVPGTDLLHFLQKEPINGAPWQLALQQVRSLFQAMQDYHIVHGDMKASNFISLPDRLIILDLDAMRQERNPARFSRDFRRDQQRFLRNWQENAPAATAVTELLNEIERSKSST